jgi:catechol 2,3-dioxygenase
MKGFLPDQTRVSQVHLRTARLDELVEFYSGVIGLNVSREHGSAFLSAGPRQKALINLTEALGISPRPRSSTGLYHFALRYPTRGGLARAYRALIEAGHPIEGASDHGVSEAVYLNDPEGNGVELYADRSRSTWHWENGAVEMVTKPLDLDNLLGSDSPGADLHQHPEMGHIHLHVADLAAAERFYSEFLGFTVTQRSYAGALFFAAGGYHHHIAVNVWAGKNAAPANSLGLVSYRLEAPVAEMLYCLNHRAPLLGYETRSVTSAGKDYAMLQIRDPNGTWLEIEATSRDLAGPGSTDLQHQPSRVLCESSD